MSPEQEGTKKADEPIVVPSPELTPDQVNNPGLIFADELAEIKEREAPEDGKTKARKREKKHHVVNTTGKGAEESEKPLDESPEEKQSWDKLLPLLNNGKRVSSKDTLGDLIGDRLDKVELSPEPVAPIAETPPPTAETPPPTAETPPPTAETPPPTAETPTVPDSLKEMVRNLRDILGKKIAAEGKKETAEPPVEQAVTTPKSETTPAPESPRVLNRIFLAPQPNHETPPVTPPSLTELLSDRLARVKLPAETREGTILTPPPRVETTAEAKEEKPENPYQKEEDESALGIVERGLEAEKISPESLKVVDDFLARDREKTQREFALEWFSRNEERMKIDGVVIPPGVSDEWKIKMVLMSKEKGGMGATEDIDKPEYRHVRRRLNQIGTLKTDMARDQIPLATPFLLLNYLQESIVRKREEIAALRDAAKNGDASAGVFADNEERRLAELNSARIEVAGKATHENIVDNAKKRAMARMRPREGHISGNNLDIKSYDIARSREWELMDKEWQEYKLLPEKQRLAYQKRVGRKLEISHEEFEESLGDKTFNTPQEKEQEFQAQNYEKFRVGALMAAEDNGIVDEAFFGMLENGLRPHEAKGERWYLWNQNILVPTSTGRTRKVSSGELGDFVERFADKFKKDARAEAQRSLEAEWDDTYERYMSEEVEERIGELARSPETAIGGVERVYGQRREIIVAEHIVKRTKEAAEKKPAEVKEIKKEFGEPKEPAKPEKTIFASLAELAADVTADDSGKPKGDLETLTGEFDADTDALSAYFRKKCGVKEMTSAKLRKIIGNPRGKGIYKSRCAENNLLYWFADILTRKPWEEKA